MAKPLTLEQAAAKLGIRVEEVADAGERYGLPWAKARFGIEYVWRKRIHPTSPTTVISEELFVVAGTHGAKPAGLALPEFDPEAAAPEGEPHWPHLLWRPAA